MYNFAIAKTQPDKQYIFGWANISNKADGTQIEDWQKDIIAINDLEEAAYEHVLHFRSTGEKHDPTLREKGKLIESMVFTKEKINAFHIPHGIMPEGWWVGYKITDSAAWGKIKKGEYNMFSIEGHGQRESLEKSKKTAKTFLEIYAPIY